MAGDWIKMRSDLSDDPAVFKIAGALNLDRFSVIGRLHAFWAWADKHAVDGRVSSPRSTPWSRSATACRTAVSTGMTSLRALGNSSSGVCRLRK